MLVNKEQELFNILKTTFLYDDETSVTVLLHTGDIAKVRYSSNGAIAELTGKVTEIGVYYDSAVSNLYPVEKSIFIKIDASQEYGSVTELIKFEQLIKIEILETTSDIHNPVTSVDNELNKILLVRENDLGEFQYSKDGLEWFSVSAVSELPGPPGPSAFDVAVENGFVGTEKEWLESLKAVPIKTDFPTMVIANICNMATVYTPYHYKQHITEILRAKDRFNGVLMEFSATADNVYVYTPTDTLSDLIESETRMVNQVTYSELLSLPINKGSNIGLYKENSLFVHSAQDMITYALSQGFDKTIIISTPELIDEVDDGYSKFITRFNPFLEYGNVMLKTSHFHNLVVLNELYGDNLRLVFDNDLRSFTLEEQTTIKLLKPMIYITYEQYENIDYMNLVKSLGLKYIICNFDNYDQYMSARIFNTSGLLINYGGYVKEELVDGLLVQSPETINYKSINFIEDFYDPHFLTKINTNIISEVDTEGITVIKEVPEDGTVPFIILNGLTIGNVVALSYDDTTLIPTIRLFDANKNQFVNDISVVPEVDILLPAGFRYLVLFFKKVDGTTILIEDVANIKLAQLLVQSV